MTHNIGHIIAIILLIIFAAGWTATFYFLTIMAFATTELRRTPYVLISIAVLGLALMGCGIWMLI